MPEVTNLPESNTLGVAAATPESYQVDIESQCDTVAGVPNAAAPGALVDWDHKGRVTRSRFSDGHICQFRYDEDGNLYGFIYGKLAWSSNDGFVWSAQDSANLYIVEGTVRVNVDGTLSIERDSFTRTIKLNGVIVDEYKNGTALETSRAAGEPKPADLLADVHRKDGVATTQNFSPPEFVNPRSVSTRVDLSKLNLSPSGAHLMIEPSPAATGKSTGQSMLDGSVVERAFITDELRTSHLERARAVGRQNRETGIHQKPTSASLTEAEPAVTAAGTKRPLAVGKRMNRLRVVEDTAAQQALPPPAENPRVSFRQKFEELRLAVMEQLIGADHVALAGCLDSLAEVYYQQRRVNDAREAHERALAIRCAQLGPLHADTSINLHGLGRIYHEWGRYTEAEEQYAQAIRVSGKGLQKARFMRESGLTGDEHIIEHIGRLLHPVLSLAKLYSEQQRRNLCVELLVTATNVRNSIDACYHANFDHIFDSLSSLASPDHEDSRKEPAAYTRNAKVVSA